MNFDIKKIFKQLLPHLGSIVFFVLVTGIYFTPQFQGKAVNQGDIASWKGMSKEAREYQKKGDEMPLWTNSMFGGMPTFQISLPEKSNLMNRVKNVFQLDFAPPSGMFITALLCSYILFLVLGCNVWLALLGSIGYAFTTYHFVIYEAGHSNKLWALSYLPMILAGIYAILNDKIWLGGALFALGMGLNITSNHVQMTYYMGLAVLPYVLIKYGYLVREQSWNKILKYSLVFIVGLSLGIGTNTVRLWTSQEYMSSTMRGDPILEKGQAKQASSSATEGLAWEYAMNWSHGYKDLLTFIIPGAAGGGSAEPVDDSYAMYDDRMWSSYLRRSGGTAPLYHGSLPFTSGPVYFGAIFVFLFVLSMFLLKGPEKWGPLIAVLFTIMMSLGSNLEWFNRFLFEYLPKFNIFRSPNSASAITPLFIVFAGMLGLQKLLDGPRRFEHWKSPLIWSAGLTGGFCLLMWLIGPSIIDFSSSTDARFAQQGANVQPLLETRAQLFRGDSLRSMFLILLAGAGLWLYLKEKVNAIIVLAAFCGLGLFDMMSVGSRYLSQEDFVSKRQVKTPFPKRPADKKILQDNDPHFRVQDLSINTYNSSQCSYYHKCIGGYHAAKLQRYQDMIDFYISNNDQDVLNMLNTKYIITQNGKVQRNPGALGNAWFVNDIIPAEDHYAEISKVGQIDPSSEAVVHEQFMDEVKGLEGPVEGSIELTSYHPNELTYQSRSNAKGLAVFSEVWYGPEKGWHAYIDGEEVDIIRTNYILRGIVVPPGEHTIRMEFKPQTYFMGRKISLASSILLIVFALGSLVYSGYRHDVVPT